MGQNNRQEFFCVACDSDQPFRKARVQHALHALVSILSFGLWLPVWLGVTVRGALRPWVCRRCRSKRVRRGTRRQTVRMAVPQT